MSEIEKMYENYNIKPKQEGYCDWDSDYPYPDIIDNGCGDECAYWNHEDKAKYPPFTAEKQLELTKLIGLRYGLKFITNEGMDYMLSTDLYNNDNFDKQGYGYGFDEAIANLVNNLWQDLTEEEKQQIKEILNG